MKWRSALALAAGIVLGAPVARSAEGDGPVVMSLDTTTRGPTINRDIFGQFAEMLGEGIYGGVWVGPDSKIPNVRGIRSDVVGALKALKVPNVRWPGGCYGDQYHWRDGVGPSRQTRINSNWGGTPEPNTFGTHEFMDFVEQIGSEAYISLNVGSGTVQEAADWVEYMTAEDSSLARERAANGRVRPWKLKHIGIGNESWGCGGGFTPEEYVSHLKPFSLFVNNFHPDQRAATPFAPNPNRSRRIAVGDGLDKPAYTEAVMKAWKERPLFSWNIEGFSLHNYVAPAGMILTQSSIEFGEKEYASLLERSYSTERMVAQHSAIMDKYDPAKQVFIAVDEWGAWLKPLPEKPMMFLRQQNSLRDALSAAIHINGFARHADRVKLANIAQMVNVIQAMILTDGDRMLLTPTYHVFRMYVPFQDAELVPVKLDAGTYRFGESSMPRVDAVAAKAKDGGLWLALVNTDPARPITVSPAGIKARTARGEVLSADRVNAINTFAAPDMVAPKPYSAAAKGAALSLTLAPKSLTVVRLEP